MKNGNGYRYSNDDPIASLMFMASALEGGRDMGQSVPFSDAEDFGRGARFIPSEVTLARRQGLRVAFVTSCRTSKCCWYWEFQDEWGAEAFYEAKITDIFRIGANVVYVRPGVPSDEDVLQFGLRFRATFQ